MSSVILSNDIRTIELQHGQDITITGPSGNRLCVFVNGNDDPVIVPVYRDASLDEPSQVSTAADSEESASHNQLHRFNGAASARVNGSTPFNGDMASGSGTLNGGLTNGFHNSDMVV